MPRLRTLLPAEDLQRADRFCFERDRSEFVSTRAALRCALGRLLAVTPSMVDLETDELGKPRLGWSHGETSIQFNVSHSRGRAVIAISRGPRIGIDIEGVRDDLGFERVADRCFTVSERRALCDLDPLTRRSAFFSVWTRKEAFVKARGDGLSYPLSQCEVGIGGPRRVEEFDIVDLPAPQGFRAAIAIERADPSHELAVSEWRWDADAVRAT